MVGCKLLKLAENGAAIGAANTYLAFESKLAPF